jgi:hypothetical protein
MSVVILDKPVEIERLLRRLYGSARRRAARASIAFDLQPDDISALWHSQRGHCAVSGLAFHMARFSQAFVKHPYGPSLDRINSEEDYVHGNVRLVCTAVNFGLGQWGDEVFRAIAEATVCHQAAILRESSNQLSERIDAAEAILRFLSEPEAKRQRRRIAALKRARTLGPKGLSAAAKKAWEARR